MSATRSDLNNILQRLDRYIENAPQNTLNHLKAFQRDEQHYRFQVSRQMQTLKQHIQKFHACFEPEFKEILLGQLINDQVQVQALKKWLQSKPDDLAVKPVRYNQLNSIVEHSRILLEEHYESLVTLGPLPMGYNYHYNPTQVTWLGDPDPNSFYGTARVTPLKDVYLRILRAQQKKHYLYEIDPLPKLLAHDYPLPLNTLQTIPNLAYCSYIKQAEPVAFITMPHNLYELGGGHDKSFYTQDCSAYVSYYTTGAPFLTLDLHIHSLLQTKRSCLSEWVRAWSPQHNRKTPSMAVTLSHHLEPIRVQDPQRDIKPGMVISTREIEIQNDTDDQQLLGVRGHTAFVASEMKADGSFWSAGCERRLQKNIDGLGYTQTRIEADTPGQTKRLTHFFKVKPTHNLPTTDQMLPILSL